jgi:non-heme chloroperoxidase
MKTRAVILTILLVLACMLVPQVAGAQTEVRSNHFLTSDGVELHYLEAGSGPTIVFVPGILVPAEIWQPQLAHFAATHRVVALDPRSQGRSEKTTEGHHLVRRGRDIGELIEHLGSEPVVVVCWSLAVLEILTYAREFGTDEIRGLVLVDMYFGVDEELGEQHPYEAGWRPWVAGLQLDRENWTREWLRGFYLSEQSDEYFDAMTEAVLATPTNTAVTLLSNLMLMEERDWRPVVDKLDPPVLFIASSQEWAVAEAEMARERWPEMRAEVFENTGHALFVDNPELFNRVLEEFLGTLPIPAASQPSPAVQETVRPRAEVLVLGTYHMSNPGRDIFNTEADDILAPQRQAEIAQLIAVLREFRPTKIAVEAGVGNDRIAERYADYVSGGSDLSRNETEQLGYRLARELGHETVYPVDADGEFPFPRLVKYAKATGREAEINAMLEEGGEVAAAFSAYLASHTILETLLYMNSEEYIAEGVGGYFEMAEFGEQWDWAGADLVSDWFRRNMRIYTNIVQIVDSPNERVLVIYGAGHLGWLQYAFDNNPNFRLRKLAEFAE